MQIQDLIVLGGGMGGLLVAHGALKLGFKVVIIDNVNPKEGSSLYNSCIPSKALAHVASVAHTVTTAGDFGIDAAFLPVKYNKIREYIIKTVDKVCEKDIIQEIKNLGGIFIIGEPKLINKDIVVINNKKIKSKKILIATGSSNIIPDIKGLQETKFITLKDLFNLNRLPEKIIILGGLPSSVEIAQALSRLGVDVTIMTSDGQLLSNEDPEFVLVVKESLEKDGVKILTNVKIKEVYVKNKRKVLEYYNDSLEEDSCFGDEILIAVGNKPNISSIGLQHAGVVYNEAGVIVDSKLRTSVRTIYAIGDVIAGSHKLAHIVEYQANLILSNAFYKIPIRSNYRNYPYVIFTSPEIAHVGMHESEIILGKNSKLDVLKFDYKDLDAAIIKKLDKGKIKLIVKSNRIVGATIVGQGASEIISELALAINMNATIDDLLTTLKPYPTFSQITRRVASRHIAKDMFNDKNKKIVKWVNDKLS